MSSILVKLVRQQESMVSERIHQIQMAAYAQEAKLLGAVSFPPLERTVNDIEVSKECFFAAYLDGVMIGIIALEDVHANSAIRISSLVVLPAFQRMGVARVLLSAVVEKFAARTLMVSTGLKNTPALALYAQFGFVEIARRLMGAEKLPIVELSRAAAKLGVALGA